MISSTAILGVVYPAAVCFLDDYLDSWSAQSDSGFTLCLVNDGVQDLDALLADRRSDIRVRAGSGTPAALRALGIQWCLEQRFEAIILADCDDTFDSSRMAATSKWLEQGYDIVANEIVPFGSGVKNPRPWLGPRLSNGREIALDDITHGNMLGLSNCAVRTSALSGEHLDIPHHLAAFDWPWFSALLAGGARAVFTDETFTRYRQHQDNLVGQGGVDDAAIVGAVRIKAATYGYLQSISSNYGPLAECFAGLEQRLVQDESFKQRYLAQARAQADPDGFWWECALADEEIESCR